jgi:16S rRNA (cytosine967-C5)-methyltransferase
LKTFVIQNPRQASLLALRAVSQQGAYADAALDRVLQRSDFSERDRRFATELVYGCVRRQRTLDALIDQLGKKKAHQQPPDLRLILHLGLYQLRYLSQVPAPAAVDTTVTLAKHSGFSRLAGVVNGILRQYMRLTLGEPLPQAQIPGIEVDDLESHDPLKLPPNPVERLGILHSYPDWMVQQWYDQLQDWIEVEALCQYLNQAPPLDLRINLLKTSLEQVESAFKEAGIQVSRMPWAPQALRVSGGAGAVQNWPGFQEGWWSVQDSSAQLVGHLLDPQPGETIIDACAAPGGKTTHMAELMGDRGTIWACDRYASRLKRLRQNCDRLQLHSIKIFEGDSRDLPQFQAQADRVLLDAPCSGLGTLNRHADARWRQSPETVAELAQLQQELLRQTATWVKPGGVMVYATCTLHPAENAAVVQQFLAEHPAWSIDKLPDRLIPLRSPEGWIQVWPQRHQMDGFFMVRLKLEASP